MFGSECVPVLRVIGCGLALFAAAGGEAGAVPLQEHAEHSLWVFDDGPFRRPVRRPGIGRVHLEVTTAVAEVQGWFDQAHNLVGSGELDAAERAFRWCLVLDEDCGMAWWGLARLNFERGETAKGLALLEQAEQRADRMSARELRLVQAFRHAHGRPGTAEQSARRLADALERLLLDHPDEIEARLMLAAASLQLGARYGSSLILAEILEQRPEHPTALALWIETWSELAPERATRECLSYASVAPRSAVAQLRAAEGLARAGRLDEAVLAADRALRLERERLASSLDCLQDSAAFAEAAELYGWVQRQRGQAAASTRLSSLLLRLPESRPGDDRARHTGLRMRVRELLEARRWDALLDPEELPWPKSGYELSRTYCETLARLERGELEEAKVGLARLRAWADESRSTALSEAIALPIERMLLELRGLLRLREGRSLRGIQELRQAAEEERAADRATFPPESPRPSMVVLAEAYLSIDAAGPAEDCFRRGLEQVPGHAAAFDGLRRACAAQGREPPEREFALAQRDAEAELRARGPLRLEPAIAPDLMAFDSGDQLVGPEQLDGHYTVLVFYLGEECVHCLEQLTVFGMMAEEFEKQGVQVMAISSDTPQENRESEEVGELPFRLLSDPDLANARRFGAWCEYEEMDLHATLILDPQRRLRWVDRGAAPFEDAYFVLRQLRLLQEADRDADTVGAGSSPR